METEVKKILILYAEVVGYVRTMLDAIAGNYPVKIVVVQWDKDKLSKFQSNVSDSSHLKIYNKSTINIFNLTKEFQPDLLLVSGWMDKDYLKVVKFYKGKIPIVAMSDTKWLGTFKQHLFRFWPFNQFLKRKFDYFWVPGVQQITFARNMGYKDDRIIQNLYSADASVYHEAYLNNLEYKIKSYPHVFLFVGRIAPEKGCDLLIEAFLEVKEELENDWKLVLIGNNSIPQMKLSPDVIIKDFMPASQLADEVKNAGVFCMPSHREQWGVAIHEFALSGLPLLNSDICGANSAFLIEGFNGFVFKTSNKEDLKTKIKMFILIDDIVLCQMGENSNELGKRITPKISAASLMGKFLK